MIIALDARNQLINAQDAEKSNRYYCPACKDTVVFKKGEIRLPHFSHKSQHTCHMFSEGETEEHLQGKSLLYEWLKTSGCQQVALEVYLPDLQQRPDVLFSDENGQLVCLEFQCSYLNPVRLLNRHRGYVEKGYRVYWLAGENFRLHRQSLSQMQQLLLTLDANEQFVFLQLDTSKHCLTAYYHFKTKGPHTLTYDKRRFSLKDYSFQAVQSEIVQLTGERTGDIKQDYQATHKLYMKRLYYREKKLQPVLQEMYRNRDHLQVSTHHLYHSLSSEWLIKTEPLEWKYAYIRWLNSQPLDSTLTLSDILGDFETLPVSYIDNPSLSNELKRVPLLEYFNYFMSCGYIEMIGPELFLIKRHIENFKTIQEKMCFLRSASPS